MEKTSDFFHMDKTAFQVFDKNEEPDEAAYWLSRPPEERFAAVEFLRRMEHGYDATTARLQRVFRIVERGES